MVGPIQGICDRCPPPHLKFIIQISLVKEYMRTIVPIADIECRAQESESPVAGCGRSGPSVDNGWILHCTALHCTVLHCTALHCTVLHCTALHRTALHCTALHCTAPHCTALHRTALHCTALHCTVMGVTHNTVPNTGYRVQTINGRSAPYLPNFLNPLIEVIYFP